LSKNCDRERLAKKRAAGKIPGLYFVVSHGEISNCGLRIANLKERGFVATVLCDGALSLYGFKLSLFATIRHVISGERLRFKLRLPNEEWIEVEGTVTYAYPNVGFGVQFTNVSEIDKKKLEKLVSP
jgi:hypothetical protein